MNYVEDRTIDLICDGVNSVGTFQCLDYVDCDPDDNSPTQMHHGILAAIAFQLGRIADALESANGN